MFLNQYYLFNFYIILSYNTHVLILSISNTYITSFRTTYLYCYSLILKDLMPVEVEGIGSKEIGKTSVVDEPVNYGLILKGDDYFD